MAGVHVIRTIDDAIALRADLRPGAQMVVIGAGFIGAEVASTARKLGMDVTIVEAAPTPLQLQLGARLGAVVAAAHAANGTTLICGVGVAGLTGEHRALRATASPIASPASISSTAAIYPPTWSSSGSVGYPTSNGFRGAAWRSATACLRVQRPDCDPECRGCRRLRGLARSVYRRAHRVEHWTGALERPAIAVATVLAGGLDLDAAVKPPYFWSDQYGSRIQFAGMVRPDDEITIEEGSCEEHCFVATYRRDSRLVAVLGVDQPRLFTRWRRQIGTVHAAVLAQICSTRT